MAKKISELTELAAITGNDYIEVSEDAGGGVFNSKKFKPKTAANYPAGNTSGNVVPLNNGTLNVGLNADKLDGQEGSYYAPASRTITAGAGLTGGGDLSADRTLSAIDATVQTLTCADTVTINWSLGSTAKMTLDRAVAFTFTGAYDGQRCVLILTQDATGGRAITCAQARGSTDLSFPPTLSGANKTDYLGFIYNNNATKYDFVSINKGF